LANWIIEAEDESTQVDSSAQVIICKVLVAKAL